MDTYGLGTYGMGTYGLGTYGMGTRPNEYRDCKATAWRLPVLLFS